MPKPQNRFTVLFNEQLKAERIQQVLDGMLELGLSSIQLLPDRVSLVFLAPEEAQKLREQGLDLPVEVEKAA